MDKDRFQGTARQMGGKVEGAVGDLTGDTQTKMDGLTNEVTGKVQDAFGQAKDAVRTMANQASDTAGQAFDRGGAYIWSGKEQLNKSVNDNTMIALLCGGVIGYLLGLLLHSSRH